MANNKKYKHFEINDAIDGMTLLASLISSISSNLIVYKRYSAEAEALFEKHKDNDYVSSLEYETLNDKLLYRQRELLKFFSEQQSDSFSYKSTRQLLVKKGYLKAELPSDALELLNEFLDIRNLTFHNTYSKLIAARESAEHNIPDVLKGIVEVRPMLNPVLIDVVDKYEIILLASLVSHCEKRIVEFEYLLNLLKIDYEYLNSQTPPSRDGMMSGITKKDIDYIERHITGTLFGSGLETTQLAMGIQKAKYDGSEKSFKELVFKNNQT